MHGNLALMSIIILAVFLLFMAQKSIGAGDRDTLSKGESLTGSQTLTSKNELFELGFVNTSTNKFYLSISYIGLIPNTIVWVANRDKPLPDATGSKLKIASNGNLELYNGRNLFWSTSLPLSTSPETAVAVLGGNGNLILSYGWPGMGFPMSWQSFDHPTDTWLPGATLGREQRLVSWTSENDPSPGMFSAEISSESTIVFKWNDSAVYWESATLESGQFGFEKQSNYWRLENTVFERSMDNNTTSTRFVFSMLVMDHVEGRLKRLTSWGSREGTWDSAYLTSTEPFCGAYGILSSISNNPCTCLNGFSSNPMGRGCDRKTDLPPNCAKGEMEDFMEIKDIKWPNQPQPSNGAATDMECRRACLRSCSCKAYALNGSECLLWEGDLYGLRHQVSENTTLHVRLASSDIPKGESKSNKNILEVIIAVVVPVLVLGAGAFLGFFYNRRTKHNKVNKETGEDLLSFDFNSTNDGTILRTRSNMEIDLPMFSYSSVSAATNNFSPENKLGEGGFGPVYKGQLQNGQEVALKRLSQKSAQGFEEFRNEISLIAKLQHRNLVRLLGCCIDPNESILIYEYIPNKSLDLFLFGSNKQDILDWKTRTRIVEGIAQGLLYLHEYSRVRIIHRDLKASNILVDDEMNPKISDFGMARIFGGSDSRGYTNRVVGTFGYIAPEYALEGLFSTKSDVYSFGVLVLEIISGRKNTGFYKTDSLHLLGHAWDLWISGRGVELVDGKVGPQVASTALRYINVGLLCVQENPNDRPNMSGVVSMLSCEISVLPPPKKPAFSTTNLLSSYSSHTKSAGDPYPSANHLTVSNIVPR